MSEHPAVRPNPITRAIIDSTVERSLREIAEDPKRSVRKLADLGRLFTKGRFTNEVYSLVQDLLHNDESPYYEAIEKLLRSTDQQILKTFGINLGYNGLNIGGKITRLTRKDRTYHIPWIISVRINPSLLNSMSVSEIDNIITQAKPLGIYCFGIRIEGSLMPLVSLTEVMRRHSECAFFCLLPDQKLMSLHLDAIRQCPASLFLLHTGNRNLFSSANAEALRRQKSLYGVFSLYDDQTASSWISGEKIKELLDYETPWVVLAADDLCSRKTRQRVSRQCHDNRMHPHYPLVFFDQIGDIMSVDKLRSDLETGYYFEMLETGDIRTDREIITDFRHTVSLEQLLSIALPYTD